MFWRVFSSKLFAFFLSLMIIGFFVGYSYSIITSNHKVSSSTSMSTSESNSDTQIEENQLNEEYQEQILEMPYEE